MIYKIAKCKCGYRRYDNKIEKTPVCKKCGAALTYSKNWYFRYKFRGREFLMAGGPTKALAEAALAKRKIDIFEKKHGIEKEPSTLWTDAKKVFLSWAQTNLKPGTLKMYKGCLGSVERLYPGIKLKTLDEITSSDVEGYKTLRSKDENIQVATINREVTSIKRVLSWATEQRPPLLLPVNNKIMDVKLFKEPKGRIRWITEEEQWELLKHCKTPHLRMAVIIALETGLRLDGCLTLLWTEIKGGIITKKVKNDTVVRVPVTETLRRELEAYKESSKVLSKYVIPSPVDPGSCMKSDANFGFQTAVKNAKIEDFTFHDLRHTFATHFLARTGDLRTLQEILGHASITMTEKYAHVMDQFKREQMEKFDKGRKNDTAENADEK